MNEYLFEQITAPENLLAAWRAVRGNIPRRRRSRAGGSDGVSLDEFEHDLAAQLAALREMLLGGRYQPQPPAVFDLPKRGGGLRRIAVLSVRDRVAQRAAQQILEPLWEPHFLPCSFGFRPGLSTLHAAAYVQEQRAAGCAWLVDGDIAACFDSLDHDLLLSFIRRKVSDGRVLNLLQAWLDSGAGVAGLPQETPGAQAEVDAAALAKQGLSWLLDFIGGEETDPYQAGRYENGAEAGELSPRPGSANLRRLAWQGLAFGAAWAQPALSKLSENARVAINTPAGRRLLKQGALVSGGLAGAAAAAALAAWWLNRRAGPAPAGVQQGSPLSPLLANIYLHPFDATLTRAGLRLARYADDWVICCPDQAAAEAAYNQSIKTLARLRLKINPAKTRLLPPGEALEWLGIWI